MTETPGLSRMTHASVEFHTAFGEPFGGGDVHDSALRIRLHQEENRELVDALEAGDLVAAAHELADVVYVAYGSAYSLGIPLDLVLREVHRANMSKIGPDGRATFDEGGKLVKPDGFQPPDVRRVLVDAHVDIPEPKPARAAREPALIYDDEGNFHGVQGGACEHRTVGSHRAWCHDCREWCYPTGPCVRCKFEPSEDTGQAPDVAAAVLAAAVAWKARYDEMFDEPPARGTTMRPIYDALLGTDADAPLTERPLAGDPGLPLSAMFDNRDPHQDEMRAGTVAAEHGPVYVKSDEELPHA